MEYNSNIKYNKTFIVSKDSDKKNNKKILEYLQNRFSHTNISIQLK